MANITEYRQQHPEVSGMSDEALGDVLFKTYYEPKGMPRSEFDTKFGLSQRMGTGEDVLRSAATGAGEGVTSSVGLLGDVQNFMGGVGTAVGDFFGLKPLTPEQQAGFDNPGEALSLPNIKAPTTASIDEATGFNQIKHQPQTTAGEYARTGASFVTPTFVTGLVKGGLKEGAKLAAKYGAVPAVTSETAGQGARKIAPEYEAAARILGGLGGGGVMAAISRPSSAAAVIKKAMPPGVTNNDIMRADALMAQGRQRGITLTWPEALHQVTNGRVDVTGLQRIVEQTTGGGPTLNQTMSQRPAQVEQGMGGAMTDLSAGGQMVDPRIAGQTIQRGAERGITDIRQAINQATEPLYRKSATDIIDLNTFDALSKDPVYKAALKAVRDDPVHSRAILGLPDRAVGVQNEIKKYLDDVAGTAGTSGRNRAAAVYGGVRDDVRGAASAASPDYQQALAAQTDLRQQYLNPAESGPLGAMSKTDDILAQGKAVLAAAPAEGSQQAVRETIGLLSRRSPDAALQLVRTHLRNVFDETSQNLISGGNQWGGAKFVAAIRGNSQQARNLEAAIRALPDGDARWRGLNAFLDVLEATGRRQRPGSLTAFNQEAMAEMKRGGLAVEGIRTVRSLGRRVEDFYDQWKLGNVSADLARMMTDPRSAGLLRNLAAAKTPGGRQTLAGYLVAFYASQQGQKPPAPVEEQVQQNGSR